MMIRSVLCLIISLFFFSSCSRNVKTYDICVYGGTSAGVIAAYAAKKMNKKVIVVSQSKHVGGLSSSGLGATDIGNKYAVTGLSRDFYRRLGNHYGKLESWTFEPHVAEGIFEDYINDLDIKVIRGYQIIEARKEESEINEIVLERAEDNSGENDNLHVKAKMFIDCTYEGDLMALANVSYTVGREPNNMYNESLNGVQLRDEHQFPDGIDPWIIPGDSTSGLCWGIHPEPLEPNGTGDKKVQAYNYRLCLTQDSSKKVPFTKPANYNPDRYELLRRVIQMREDMGWKQKLGWFYLRIVHMPNGKTDVNNKGPLSTDYIGGNWDYPEADYETRKKIEKEHEEYIRGLLYFLSHDEEVTIELKQEMNSWGWAKDEFTDNNYFPYKMYVREARRMIGEYVMTEHNCTGAVTVNDGIGLAAYTMDSHNCQRVVVNGMVKNEGDVQFGGFPPYPISYRALIPKEKECTNLLVPVCLSATHIAYGSIRMEPVFMVLGQVAGIAASLACDNNQNIQQISVPDLQNILNNDPMLDGSIPDMTIDNSDSTEVHVTGDWKINSLWMGQYKQNFLQKDPDKTGTYRVKYTPDIATDGMYNLYLYIPRLEWNKNEITKFSQSLPVKIKHANGEKTVLINCEKYRKDWAPIGKYKLSSEKQTFVEIIADTVQANVPADALLLVHSNSQEK